MSHWRNRAFLALTFLLILSCIAAAAQPDPTEELSFILADIELSGPTEKIETQLEGFITKYPRSNVSDEAIMSLASIYLDKKEFKKSSFLYEKILKDFPFSRYKIEALYGLGMSEYKMGEANESKGHLEAVISSKESTLSNKVRARLLLKEMASSTETPREKRIAEEKKPSLPERPSEGATIGAILPLSGQHRAVGEAGLKGILLAAGIFGKGEEFLEVIVKDSGEGVEEETIDEITLEKNTAALIVAPPSQSAQKIADIVQKRNIPSIMLSQKEALPQVGNYVFRLFLTPKEQTQAIIKFAVEKMGIEKIAILYPDNAYGKDLADSFRTAAAEKSVVVTGELSYPPGKKDFGEEIKSIFGVEAKEKHVGRRRMVEYTPTIKIDALYIPDYYTTVSQIAPYLGYYNVKDVQLLGANGWNSPKLTSLAGDHIEGALFVDGFFSKSTRPETMKFVQLFKDVYGYEPGSMEAYSYDSTMAVLNAMALSGTGRDALREGLEKTGFRGASGNISFDKDREATRELFILKVEKGVIVEVQSVNP